MIQLEYPMHLVLSWSYNILFRTNLASVRPGFLSRSGGVNGLCTDVTIEYVKIYLQVLGKPCTRW